MSDGPVRRLSVVMIALNEARSLPRAIRSVAWADEVVVVDSGSTDGTAGLARELGARVLHREWTGFVDQKNFALAQAVHPWVLSLDADEECSPGLEKEIQSWRRGGDSPAQGFRVPRQAFFMGRWIRHSDWYPDWQLRLFNRETGRWETRRVHESVKVDGPVRTLSQPLLHYPYEDLGDYLAKMDAYSRLAAEDLWDRGRRARAIDVAGAPVAAFVKSYLLKRGFLEGLPGLVIAGLSAVSTFFRYARLYERGLGPRPCCPGGR